MEVHNPDNTQLNCPTCFQNFANIEAHKSHYKSDFHRYNLKRKMVKLGPISEDQFKAKRIETKVEHSEGYKCNECGKKFASSQTLNQHAESKKHNPDKEVMKAETEAAVPKVLQPFKKNATVCLFCKKQSESLEMNLRHMEGTHGFFIPQLEYCKDNKGLIEYLQEKVEVGFFCIFCENKGAKDFSTGEAVRKHMIKKGHTFMKTDEGYEEYENFYDFSKQFQDLLALQKDANVPGISYTTVKVYATEKDGHGNEEDEWEDEDNSNEDSEEWEDDEGEDIQKQGEEEQIKEKNKKRVISYNIMKPTMTANDELLLPNGKTLGHRKYRFLYKQTYRNPFWLESRMKAIGWNGEAATNALLSRQHILQKTKHDHVMHKTKIRNDKYGLRKGMQNNMIMKFFRCATNLG